MENGKVASNKGAHITIHIREQEVKIQLSTPVRNTRIAIIVLVSVFLSLLAGISDLASTDIFRSGLDELMNILGNFV